VKVYAKGRAPSSEVFPEVAQVASRDVVRKAIERSGTVRRPRPCSAPPGRPGRP